MFLCLHYPQLTFGCLFVCCFFFVYSHTSNVSAIWRLSPLPVAGLQIFAYVQRTGPLSTEGSLSCHTFCDTGPRFIRSHPKDQHPRPTVGFEPLTQGSSDLCARRTNHFAMRAVTYSLGLNDVTRDCIVFTC
jgi:hypothetical protein